MLPLSILGAYTSVHVTFGTAFGSTLTPLQIVRAPVDLDATLICKPARRTDSQSCDWAFEINVSDEVHVSVRDVRHGSALTAKIPAHHRYMLAAEKDVIAENVGWHAEQP